MRLLLINFVFVALASGAPRSKNNDKLTTYDQKQTGDYNIQLHLKDFQIVALLGDDTLGAFGDYEYNYDYSDLTIKPHNATTAKPAEISSSSTTSQKPLLITELKPLASSSTPVPSTTTQKLPETSSYKPLNFSKTIRSDDLVVVSKSTTEKPSTDKLGEKIPKVTSVTIVPSVVQSTSTSNNANILNLGEILHYRKCPTGYSKDKRGRCRRTRRPAGVIPYGITRFASNLAAKFREAVSSDDDEEDEIPTEE